MARKAIPLDGAPDIDEFFGDLGKAIVGGSSMACALIATSVVENTLMSLLVTFFVKGSTTDGLFKGGRGLLGDLFKCTQMAYCIGLIREPVKWNLEIVGDIRNTFAHSTKLVEFEDATIVSLCSKLTLPKGRSGNTLTHSAKYPLSRMQFTAVCGFLCQHLLAYAPLYAHKLAVYRDQLPRAAATEW